MIIIPHEQLAEQIPASNRIFSRNRAEEYLYSLLERTKYRLDQATLSERFRARNLNLSSQELFSAMELYQQQI